MPTHGIKSLFPLLGVSLHKKYNTQKDNNEALLKQKGNYQLTLIITFF